VFQNYALFPHMSVAENVEFGLKMRGIKGHERDSREFGRREASVALFFWLLPRYTMAGHLPAQLNSVHNPRRKYIQEHVHPLVRARGPEWL